MKQIICFGVFCIAFMAYIECRHTTIEPTPEDVKCPPQLEDKPNLIADPKNCSTYYVCNGGRAIKMPCPDGLQFNPKEEACDWPFNVNCTTYEDNSESEEVTEEILTL